MSRYFLNSPMVKIVYADTLSTPFIFRLFLISGVHILNLGDNSSKDAFLQAHYLQERNWQCKTH